jgi:hypothetical protein
MADDRAVFDRLAEFFRRNGYVRRQNKKRVKAEGSAYKKGDEVRLIAKNWGELMEVRGLLRKAGFKPGRSFQKVAQYCQPIYGRQQVARFLESIGEPPDP